MCIHTYRYIHTCIYIFNRSETDNSTPTWLERSMGKIKCVWNKQAGMKLRNSYLVSKQWSDRIKKKCVWESNTPRINEMENRKETEGGSVAVNERGLGKEIPSALHIHSCRMQKCREPPDLYLFIEWTWASSGFGTCRDIGVLKTNQHVYQGTSVLWTPRFLTYFSLCVTF